MWDLTAGAGSGLVPGTALAGHLGPVSALACVTLPDDRVVAVTGGDDGAVRVWDLTAGAGGGLVPGAALAGHARQVSAVACATLPDGRVVAVTSDDRQMRMWDLLSGTLAANPIEYGDPVWTLACAVLPDGRAVAVTGGRQGTAGVWDLSTSALVAEVHPGHAAGISAIAATTLSDGRSAVVTVGNDKTARVWNPATGSQLISPLPVVEGVRSLATTRIDGVTRVILVGAGVAAVDIDLT